MEEAENVALKELLRAFLCENCEVLTVGQPYVDWVVLWQFRVTSTNAGIILMSYGEVRFALGITAGERQDKSLSEWFELFFNSWFSSKVSTEAM